MLRPAGWEVLVMMYEWAGVWGGAIVNFRGRSNKPFTVKAIDYTWVYSGGDIAPPFGMAAIYRGRAISPRDVPMNMHVGEIASPKVPRRLTVAL